MGSHSAFHDACVEGHVNMVKCFLDVGFDINFVGSAESTGFTYSCVSRQNSNHDGKMSIVALLLDRGYDFNMANFFYENSNEILKVDLGVLRYLFNRYYTPDHTRLTIPFSTDQYDTCLGVDRFVLCMEHGVNLLNPIEDLKNLDQKYILAMTSRVSEMKTITTLLCDSEILEGEIHKEIIQFIMEPINEFNLTRLTMLIAQYYAIVGVYFTQKFSK
jgi:hypothetical protein